MGNLEPLNRHGPNWQIAQVIEIAFSELRGGPQVRGPGNRIKPLQIDQARAGAIVIPPYYRARGRAYPFDDRIRVRSISGQIAAAYDAVISAVSIREDCLQRLPVRVQVTKNEIAQSVRLFLSGIVKSLEERRGGKAPR